MVKSVPGGAARCGTGKQAVPVFDGDVGAHEVLEHGADELALLQLRQHLARNHQSVTQSVNR